MTSLRQWVEKMMKKEEEERKTRKEKNILEVSEGCSVANTFLVL